MIIVFGSMNIDFLARSAHLPQEGETVITPEDYVEAPGGKGMNQAVAAARAGATVKMAGKVGQDAFGEKVRRILKEEGIDASLLQAGTKKTALAFIFVDQKGANQIVVASGANMEARAEQVPDDLFNDKTTLVLQMEVTPAENWKLLARAKQRGARTILNVAPAGHVPEEALENIDYLILNEIEAKQLCDKIGLKTASQSEDQLALSLSAKYNLACIVTLGKNGALAAENGKIIKVPSPSLDKVVDTTGAGDSFCGNFAAAVDAGDTLHEAMKSACIGGSLACRKIGAQSSLPYRKDIKKLMM